MVRKTSGKKRESRAERFFGGEEVKAGKNYLSYASRMAVVEKLAVLKDELKKLKKVRYSLEASLQLTQRNWST